MGVDFLAFNVFELLSLLFMFRVWGHVFLVEPDWCEFSLSLSVYLEFVHLFLPVRGFVSYSRIYMRFPLGFPRIHAGSLRTVAYTLVFTFLWKIVD